MGLVAAPFGAGGTTGALKTFFFAGIGAFTGGATGLAGCGAADFGTLPCTTSASAESNSRADRIRAS